MRQKETTRLFAARNGLGFFAFEGNAKAMYRKFSTFLRYSIRHNQPAWLSLEGPNFRLVGVQLPDGVIMTTYQVG